MVVLEPLFLLLFCWIMLVHFIVAEDQDCHWDHEGGKEPDPDGIDEPVYPVLRVFIK